MATIKLTIQHGTTLIEPPVKDGIKIEWERTGSPGKLTFTTIRTLNNWVEFTEGDPVSLYYDNKVVFVGYVFTKKRDREQHIEVTCYDQIRYLKNKYTYSWENKTATQIIKALCQDMKLNTGSMDDTKYVIPAIAEENKSALDIILDVLEETLLNTGNMYVLYDDVGKLRIRNVEEMTSSTLIYSETAENFDYSSSIDSETYNNVILYYKKNDQIVQLYTASSASTIKQWGMLRYFEEVDTPTIGQNKANSLLRLYNRKTRELKVSGAFGDIGIRAGTLIPVRLDLGDVNVNNFMLVEKVTHNFNKDNHTMDLTLQGYWDDAATDITSKTIGEIPADEKQSSGSTSSAVSTPSISMTPSITNAPQTGSTATQRRITIEALTFESGEQGRITVRYVNKGSKINKTVFEGTWSTLFDAKTYPIVEILPPSGGTYTIHALDKTHWAEEKEDVYSVCSEKGDVRLIVSYKNAPKEYANRHIGGGSF